MSRGTVTASFEPLTVPVGSRRMSGVGTQVISLYAKGLTTGDISAHLLDVYDKNIDRSTISHITDGIVDDMLDWQSRPLDPIYPVLLVDGIRIEIRDGTVSNRTVYVVMGVNMDGERDILGLWVGPTGGESAKFWLGVFSELKNRGVDDALSRSEARWDAPHQRRYRHASIASGGKLPDDSRRKRAVWDSPNRPTSHYSWFRALPPSLDQRNRRRSQTKFVPKPIKLSS